MQQSSRTKFRPAPPGLSIRWLSTALLVALAGCHGAEAPDAAEGTATEADPDRADLSAHGVTAHGVTADGVTAHGVAPDGVAAEGMGDVPPLDGAGDAPNGDGSAVITDPVTQAYLNRSPIYQRYRAFVERQQKEAARAATPSASDLPADERPATDLSAGDFSEGELFDATIASFVLPPGTDTLAMYANRCDAATGIHVPAFNCNLGTEIPQGTIQTTLIDASAVPRPLCLRSAAMSRLAG